MSKLPTPPGLLPSLLDRLIDPRSMGTGGRLGYDLKQMTDTIRSDLEDLLNTRVSATDLPPQFPQVRDSILAYGLPDLSEINAASSRVIAEFGQMIEAIIVRFEPRLRGIRVSLVEQGKDTTARSIRFHVEAAINADPAPEVGFETILELTTGRATVQVK
jgi:type VI secretion system protein ImpF